MSNKCLQVDVYGSILGFIVITRLLRIFHNSYKMCLNDQEPSFVVVLDE